MLLSHLAQRTVFLVVSALAGSVLPAHGAEGKSLPLATAPPRSRTFLFTYGVLVTGLPPGKTVRLWLPMPPANEDQDVKMVARELPAKHEMTRETEYGNHILYVEAQPNAEGAVHLEVTYRVIRREVKADLQKHKEDTEKLARYLQPDAMVPVDGKPLELLKGRELPEDQLAIARILYDVVNSHMKYEKKGTGWGRGDAVWACEHGYGNCTDFHSLFIALARSQKIPAQFEIGFPLPVQRGAGLVPGYHCWAKFRPSGKDWIPVDISEANQNPKLHDYYFGNLSENRVAFSTGRDITLVPKQTGKPLNFFIYPYVELDGKAYPAGKVQTRFSYKDLPARKRQ